MKEKVLVLFLVFGPLYGVAQNHENVVFDLKATSANPRNSEGSFIFLKGGRIMFVYTRFEGASSDHTPARLVSRFSDDNGITWTAEDTPVVDREGDMNVMSASLIRLKKSGNIALFYLKKNSMEDCIPQMRISRDEGKSWSKPTPVVTDQLGYFVLNNDRVIQLKNGRILVPVSLHNTPGSSYSYKGKLNCYYSDDEGVNWKKGQEVQAPDSIITQEPGIVELKNGNVMMIIRANFGRQYQAFSKDRGFTWSPATPTEINSPISPASIRRINRKGDIILVWNNNGETGPGYYKAKRSPLTVAISEDNGVKWRICDNMEDNKNEEYAYVSILNSRKYIFFGYYVKPSKEDLYSLRIRRYSIGYFY